MELGFLVFQETGLHLSQRFGALVGFDGLPGFRFDLFLVDYDWIPFCCSLSIGRRSGLNTEEKSKNPDVCVCI